MVSGLFKVHLNTSDVTLAHLLEELKDERAYPLPGEEQTLVTRIAAIYALLQDLTKTAEDVKLLR